MIQDYTGFVLQKLDKKDWTILFLLAVVLSLSELNFLSLEINIWISVLIFFFPYWFLDVRFRNILFSAIWLILISQYYLIVHYDFSFVPLLGFVCYNVTRLIFWIKNKREFIPTMWGYSHYRGRYSKILKRKSDDGDAVFSVFLFFGSIILLSFWI